MNSDLDQLKSLASGRIGMNGVDLYLDIISNQGNDFSANLYYCTAVQYHLCYKVLRY